MKSPSTVFNWTIWIVILLTVVLSITCLPAAMTDPFPDTAWEHLYFISVYIAQNFLLSILCGIPLFFIGMLARPKIKLILFMVCITFFLMSFILSAKIYAFWHFYFNEQIFHLFFSKGGGNYVFEIGFGMYLSIFLSFLFFILLALLTIFSASYCVMKNFRHVFIFSVLLFIYVIAQVMTILFVKTENMAYLQYTVKSPYFINLSLANAFMHVDHSLWPSDGLSIQLHDVLKRTDKLHYPKHPLRFSPVSQPKNVLIIAVDTLRADKIQPDVMPNVFAFSKQSDQFLSHFSGGNCTEAGIFSLFYGFPVSYWHSIRNYPSSSLLMNAFATKNYDIKLLSSAGFLSPAFDQTVFYRVKGLQLLTEGLTPWQRDVNITLQMKQFLKVEKNANHHFFAFMFYDGPHAYNALAIKKPFTPIKTMNYFTVDKHTDPRPLENAYNNAVHADDMLIGMLFKTLKETGLLNNTIVIITSDHGQEFNEFHNNYWEHPSGFSHYQIQVPFIIYWPNQKPQTYAFRTTHYDVLPTLLKHVLGVENNSSDFSIGHDLYDQTQNDNAFIVGQYGQYAFVTPRWIMPFTKNGIYRFTDTTMKPITRQSLSPSEKEILMHQMNGFFKD